jgi:hypothetical protein
MQLKPGQRLRSQVCTTEVIIIQAPEADLDLTCGGARMVDMSVPLKLEAPPASTALGGTQVGKRYTDRSTGSLQLLVTKAGTGELAVGDTPLVIMQPRPLPSSD